MEEDLIKKYQTTAETVLTRNKSITDILSKLQYSDARAERSIVKAATSCGCIQICGCKDHRGSGVEGKICEECKAEIETQLGEMIFYTASLCNALGISMEDVFRRDMERTDMMGKYSLR